MQMFNSGSDNLKPYKSTDASVPVSADTAGYTLAVATYYIPLGSSESTLNAESWGLSYHLKWNAALAATITLESTNYPARVGMAATGRADVSDTDTTAGNWIQENPATAYPGFTIGGAGNSVTAVTIVAGGTNAGAAGILIPTALMRRYRLKVVVTTGGTLRAGACGKS